MKYNFEVKQIKDEVKKGYLGFLVVGEGCIGGLQAKNRHTQTV